MNPLSILVAEAEPASPSSLCHDVAALGIELAGACPTGEGAVFTIALPLAALAEPAAGA